MTDVNNFLDFRESLVNEIAGSVIIFILLFNLVMFVICSLFRLDNRSTLMLMIASNVIILTLLNPALLALIIIFVAIFYAPILKKILER